MQFSNLHCIPELHFSPSRNAFVLSTPVNSVTTHPHLEGLFRGDRARCHVEPLISALWMLPSDGWNGTLRGVWTAFALHSHLSAADRILNAGEGIYESPEKQPKRDT